MGEYPPNVNRYLRLFRFGNGVMGIIGLLVGAFMAAGLDLGDHVSNLIIACFIVIAFIAGGNSLNDYIDIEIDKTAHPERPLPSGEIAPKTALHLGVAGLAAACVLSLLLGSVTTTTVVIMAAVFMVCYELFLKQHGFVGNITIAVLTGMVFLFGGAVVNDIEANIIVAAMAALVSVGREIAKDIEDMESDEGRDTLPMRIGVKNAGIVAAAFFIAGPILSIYPFFADMLGMMYLLVLVADAMFIYAALIIFNSAHNAQKTAKIAMFVALIAFILGVIQ